MKTKHDKFVSSNGHIYTVHNYKRKRTPKLYKDFSGYHDYPENTNRALPYIYSLLIIGMMLLTAMVVADIVFGFIRSKADAVEIEMGPVFEYSFEPSALALHISDDIVDDLVVDHYQYDTDSLTASIDNEIIEPVGEIITLDLIDDTDIERYIWMYLDEIVGLNDFAKAGLMGNWWVESHLIPNNVQDSFEKNSIHNDESYTAAVDDGTYKNFVHDGAGYGIVQWTHWSRKQGLLDMARETNRSIGDIELNLEYFMYELDTLFDGLHGRLNECKSVREASNLVLEEYERPDGYLNETSSSRTDRYNWSMEFYNKFASY